MATRAEVGRVSLAVSEWPSDLRRQQVHRCHRRTTAAWRTGCLEQTAPEFRLHHSCTLTLPLSWKRRGEQTRKRLRVRVIFLEEDCNGRLRACDYPNT